MGKGVKFYHPSKTGTGYRLAENGPDSLKKLLVAQEHYHHSKKDLKYYPTVNIQSLQDRLCIQN